MKTHRYFARLAILTLIVSCHPLLHAAGPEYQSELFKSTKLVYEDAFDDGLNTNFWEVRQSSTWSIREASPALKEHYDDLA